ncbi:MAG: phosphoribulokinase [Actinomycetota bacterium]
MSKRHPIIAVTGSSGAGRGSVQQVFDKVLRRNNLTAAYVNGDSFHRYDRAAMRQATIDALQNGDHTFSHFGPAANLFEELASLYRSYAEHGKGRRRHYLHTAEDAARLGFPELKPGEFTPWEDLPENTDMLIYEGLHGVASGDGYDLGKLVDLRLGVVPIINLEWARKMSRDTQERGYSEEAVIDSILRRMNDYVRYIIPQFKHSDINFQQVPVIDTSAPLTPAGDVPTLDESVTVIRFRKPEDYDVDFPQLLKDIERSWMSRRNTLVVPGGKTMLAMELILTPIIARLMEDARYAA